MEEEFIKKFIGKYVYIWLIGIPKEWEGIINDVNNNIIEIHVKNSKINKLYYINYIYVKSVMCICEKIN